MPHPINIGPLEIRKRRAAGFGLAVVAIGIAAGMLFDSNVPRWWRLVVLLPAWGSAQGFLQAHYSI